MSNLLDLILNAPDALSVRFQPIFEIGSDGSRVESLEALIRGPKGTNFEPANVLFDYVRRKRAESAVDRTCIATICEAASGLLANCRLNINVHASTLSGNDDFLDFLRCQTHSCALPLDRVTLEIVEHGPTHHIPELIAVLGELRNLGVRIALDDVGLGHSNYRMILDCRPEYFKLDAFFADGVSYDHDRRAVVTSIMCLADEMGGKVVAEGPRTNGDLVTLKQMGVNLFQANLLCPATLPSELLQKGVFRHALAEAEQTVYERSPILAAETTPRDRSSSFAMPDFSHPSRSV